ncbi:MAG: global nitrogen regulator NrpRII [Methanofollis sp.]|nr:global nitrogen regulator NrpRII [Methanofollis sp.]
MLLSAPAGGARASGSGGAWEPPESSYALPVTVTHHAGLEGMIFLSLWRVYDVNHPLKFLNHLIEEEAMQVTYDPAENEGKVIYNLSLVAADDLDAVLAVVKETYRAGISPSGLVQIFQTGEKAGGYTVPEGLVGICTVCSITLDGVMIRRGVPLHPIGGGVVQIEGGTPRRFTDMVLYDATTIDPLELLVSQDITNVSGVVATGRGSVLANLRECHMEAEATVAAVIEDLERSLIAGVLEIGPPNAPILDFACSPQHFGIAILGGTNVMAAVKEAGYRVEINSLKGLIDVSRLEPIHHF